jgi:sRNA-binding protein
MSGDNTDEITEAGLRARWPAAFNDERRPLKLGIHRDMGILGRSDAIRRWTAHPVYLRNVIAGGKRIDLDGGPAGGIEEIEKAYAWEKLSMVRGEIARVRRCRERPWDHPDCSDLPKRGTARREYLHRKFPSGLSLADESAEMKLGMPKRSGPRWGEYGCTVAGDGRRSS